MYMWTVRIYYDDNSEDTTELHWNNLPIDFYNMTTLITNSCNIGQKGIKCVKIADNTFSHIPTYYDLYTMRAKNPFIISEVKRILDCNTNIVALMYEGQHWGDIPEKGTMYIYVDSDKIPNAQVCSALMGAFNCIYSSPNSSMLCQLALSSNLRKDMAEEGRVFYIRGVDF